jgi:hypothetical protein
MKGGNVKHQQKQASAHIKVVTNPKKLAWLAAEIEKRRLAPAKGQPEKKLTRGASDLRSSSFRLDPERWI